MKYRTQMSSKLITLHIEYARIRNCSKSITLLSHPTNGTNTIRTITPYGRIIFRTISRLEWIDINTISRRIVNQTPYILTIHQRVSPGYRITSIGKFLPHLSLSTRSKFQELVTSGITHVEV